MTLQADQVCLSLSPGQLTLDHVSLTLKPGEVMALIGHNGAGKSTLLRALSGEQAVSSGEVLLHDQPVNSWPGSYRARMLSVLPQQHNLSFEFLVEDVVALGRYPHNSGHRHDSRLVTDALKLCDLTDLRQRTISELSGGERQRVHLARVLVQVWEAQPEGHRFLLLDEPSTGLDLHHQQSLYLAIQDFARRGVGVMLVVHDLNLAARYADRVVLMHQGRAVTCGSPRQVLTADTIGRYFGLQVSVQQHPLHDCPLIITH